MEKTIHHAQPKEYKLTYRKDGRAVPAGEFERMQAVFPDIEFVNVKQLLHIWFVTMLPETAKRFEKNFPDWAIGNPTLKIEPIKNLLRGHTNLSRNRSTNLRGRP